MDSDLVQIHHFLIAACQPVQDELMAAGQSLVETCFSCGGLQRSWALFLEEGNT